MSKSNPNQFLPYRETGESDLFHINIKELKDAQKTIDDLCHAEAEIPIFELKPLFGEQAQHFQVFQMLYCLILTITLMQFSEKKTN